MGDHSNVICTSKNHNDFRFALIINCGFLNIGTLKPVRFLHSLWNCLPHNCRFVCRYNTRSHAGEQQCLRTLDWCPCRPQHTQNQPFWKFPWHASVIHTQRVGGRCEATEGRIWRVGVAEALVRNIYCIVLSHWLAVIIPKILCG